MLELNTKNDGHHMIRTQFTIATSSNTNLLRQALSTVVMLYNPISSHVFSYNQVYFRSNIALERWETIYTDPMFQYQ